MVAAADKALCEGDRHLRSLIYKQTIKCQLIRCILIEQKTVYNQQIIKIEKKWIKIKRIGESKSGKILLLF